MNIYLVIHEINYARNFLTISLNWDLKITKIAAREKKKKLGTICAKISSYFIIYFHKLRNKESFEEALFVSRC